MFNIFAMHPHHKHYLTLHFVSHVLVTTHADLSRRPSTNPYGDERVIPVTFARSRALPHITGVMYWSGRGARWLWVDFYLISLSSGFFTVMRAVLAMKVIFIIASSHHFGPTDYRNQIYYAIPSEQLNVYTGVFKL